MMDGSGRATSKTTGMGDQQIGFERAAQVLAQQPLSVMLGARLLAIEPGAPNWPCL